MSSLEAAGFWIALNAFLLIFLSARVGQARIKTKVNLGDGDHPDMIKAIRCQGNYIEYAPMAIIGLLAIALLGGNLVLVHLLGAVFFAGRLAHFAGLGLDAWSKGRFVGTLLTMLTLLTTSLALLFLAFT